MGPKRFQSQKFSLFIVKFKKLGFSAHLMLFPILGPNIKQSTCCGDPSWLMTCKQTEWPYIIVVSLQWYRAHAYLTYFFIMNLHYTGGALNFIANNCEMI